MKKLDKLLRKIVVFKFHACLLLHFMSAIFLTLLAVDDIALIDEKGRAHAQEIRIGFGLKVPVH